MASPIKKETYYTPQDLCHCFYDEDILQYLLMENYANDKSFTIKKNSSVLHCPYALAEESCMHSPPVLLSPFYHGDSHKDRKILLQEYLDIALDSKAINLRHFDIDSEYSDFLYDTLLRNGFTPELSFISIVDLSTSLEVLWKKIRKSYKPLINSMMNRYKINIATSNEDIKEWIDLYACAYSRSGKELSKDTMNRMFYLYELGKSTVFLIYDENGELIAGLDVVHNSYMAYYSLSAILPGYESYGSFAHYLMWYAISYFKSQKLKFFEIGTIHYQSVRPWSPSEKEISISHFKSGMGGSLIPTINFLRSRV